MRGRPRFELLQHDVVEPLQIRVDEIYNLACPALPSLPGGPAADGQGERARSAQSARARAPDRRCDSAGLDQRSLWRSPGAPAGRSHYGHVNPTGPRACYDEGKRGAQLADAIGRVTPAAISRHLYVANLPDPELIIRTSGEIRLSGFLLWQSAYSEFYFADIYWPAFRKIDFRSVAAKVANRTLGRASPIIKHQIVARASLISETSTDDPRRACRSNSWRNRGFRRQPRRPGGPSELVEGEGNGTRHLERSARPRRPLRYLLLVCQSAEQVGTADDADDLVLPQHGHALDAVLLQQARDLGQRRLLLDRDDLAGHHVARQPVTGADVGQELRRDILALREHLQPPGRPLVAGDVTPADKVTLAHDAEQRARGVHDRDRADGDGKMSGAEFVEAPFSQFDAIDRNGDGEITFEEFRELMGRYQR